MNECVFDIETASLPDAEIPAALIEKLQDPEDPEAWREQLGLYALGASVVAIGLLNPESGKGAMLYDDRHGTIESIAVPDGVNITLFGGDEEAILTHFWETVARFGRVISYNGRGFDVPFLMQRSLIRGVTISVNLMPPRFQMRSNHMDLAEVLSQFRATRPYGLAAWTQAVGLTSPKEGEVAGAQVGEFFHAGKVAPILEYCLRDVVATAALSAKVQKLWSRML